jgi:hypothetical protein
MLVDHKELRFMFPMFIPFTAMVATGWTVISERVNDHFLVKPFGCLLFGINLLLLIYRLGVPSETTMPYYRYLYQQAQSNTQLLVFYYKSESTQRSYNLYGPNHLQMSFYRPVNIRLTPISHPNQMDQYDMSKSKNFVISFFPTLPPSSTKIQRLAFKYSSWRFSDLKSFHFFKKTDVQIKIFHVYPR